MSLKHRRKSQIRWKLWLSIFIAILVGYFVIYPTFFCSECNQNRTKSEVQSYSFEKILDYYGFTTPEQKNALKDLFVISSLMNENDSWEKIFPSYQRSANVFNFVTNTQLKFSNRFGKERWEVDAQPWMTDNCEKIIKDLEVLGFFSEMNRCTKNFDAICILGSNTPSMFLRLEFISEFLQRQWIKAPTVILLTGERVITENIDGLKEDLQEIAKYFKLDDWKQLTEAKVFDYLYENSPLKNMGLNVVIINTPKGELSRPTTKTEIAELKKWLRANRNVEKIMFVSNQPYLLYQKAIIQNELYLEGKEFQNIKIEMIGPSVPDFMLGHIQMLIEGLGAYIWAASPLVLKKII